MQICCMRFANHDTNMRSLLANSNSGTTHGRGRPGARRCGFVSHRPEECHHALKYQDHPHGRRAGLVQRGGGATPPCAKFSMHLPNSEVRRHESGVNP